MDNEVDITGLDKFEVIHALWKGTHQQGMGFLHEDVFPEDVITTMIATSPDRLYFDYLQGRVMKVDVSGNSFDPRLYDRDNYPGAAQAAITKLRDQVAQD